MCKHLSLNLFKQWKNQATNYQVGLCCPLFMQLISTKWLDAAAAAAASRFSHVRLCATPQMAACGLPHRLPHPWDSPGKNTGVGCHLLLQCMKVKSESEVAQSFPTLHDPMDCSSPGSSVHGILQARGLEWGAIAFSKVVG